MESIVDYLTNEHRSVDSEFAHLEDAFVDKESDNINKYFRSFSESMEIHLKREEEVLFPAFEKVMGSQMGPTQVMKMEHVQIREMIKQTGVAISGGENKKLAGLLETMMILIQQHNMKEEQMLYPMAERALSAESETIMKNMQSV